MMWFVWNLPKTSRSVYALLKFVSSCMYLRIVLMSTVNIRCGIFGFSLESGALVALAAFVPAAVDRLAFAWILACNFANEFIFFFQKLCVNLEQRPSCEWTQKRRRIANKPSMNGKLCAWVKYRQSKIVWMTNANGVYASGVCVWVGLVYRSSHKSNMQIEM